MYCSLITERFPLDVALLSLRVFKTPITVNFNELSLLKTYIIEKTNLFISLPLISSFANGVLSDLEKNDFSSQT